MNPGDLDAEQWPDRQVEAQELCHSPELVPAFIGGAFAPQGVTLWWELTLSCGHVVQQVVQQEDGERPPAAVRCEQCAAARAAWPNLPNAMRASITAPLLAKGFARDEFTVTYDEATGKTLVERTTDGAVYDATAIHTRCAASKTMPPSTCTPSSGRRSSRGCASPGGRRELPGDGR